MKDYRWIPNESLGPVKLGDNIGKYMKELNVYPDKKLDDRTGWVSYRVPDTNTYIDSEDQVVVSISSYDACIYEGNDLIGMKAAELEALLGNRADEIGESVVYDDGDVQTPLVFSDLGLLIWLSQERVTSVSVIDSRD